MSKKNPFNRPTEEISLPSKGLLYPTDHILSSGKVEIMYPGAQAEDILTNANYINNGTVIDKYLEHLLVTEVDLDDLIISDKDALMVSSRILGMGADYTVEKVIDRNPEPVTFNISEFEEKAVDWELFKPGENEFSYTLPKGKADVKFKLLCGQDLKKISEEETFLKKTMKDYSADTSLVFKFSITEVNGARDSKSIRDFVDRQLLQIDSKSLKKYIDIVTPSLVWKATGVRANNEIVEDLDVPFQPVPFFWPAS
jgi:hypothetical protein